MKGAYYVLVMPDEWGAFMTFRMPVLWKSLGINKPGETYVCSRVLAMGSSSAVALFQHVHRRSGISRGLAPRQIRIIFECLENPSVNDIVRTIMIRRTI